MPSFHCKSRLTPRDICEDIAAKCCETNYPSLYTSYSATPTGQAFDIVAFDGRRIATIYADWDGSGGTEIRGEYDPEYAGLDYETTLAACVPGIEAKTRG